METLGEKKHAKATDGDEAILWCAAWCQKRRQRFPSLMLQDKNQVVKTFTLEGVYSIAWFSVIYIAVSVWMTVQNTWKNYVNQKAVYV